MDSQRDNAPVAPMLYTLVCARRVQNGVMAGAISSMVVIDPWLDAANSTDAVTIAIDAAGALLLEASGDVEVFDENGSDACDGAIDAATPGAFSLRGADGKTASLFIRPITSGVGRYRTIGFIHDVSIEVGRSESCSILCASRFVSPCHARLTLTGDTFTIEDLGSSNGTFVNGERIGSHPRILAAGDVVQIMDLFVMVGYRFVTANEPDGVAWESLAGALVLNHAAFAQSCPPAGPCPDELDLFYPAPRLSHTIHRHAFSVDDAPERKKPDDEPAIMQLGPSFVMGLASIFMVVSAISRVAEGGDVISSMPTIAMSAGMVSGMLVWPVISKRYAKKRDERAELRRQARYTDYLNAVETRFREECELQGAALRSNRASLPDLLERAYDLSPRLMNRSVYHDDFMQLRVGLGSLPLEADIRWPQRRFSMDDDKLLDKVTELSKNPPRVDNVPLAFDLADHFVAGLLGSRAAVWDFARGLILQICALYSYREVKIVLVADGAEDAEWGFARSLPHLFDDAGQRRFLATDSDGLMAISMMLESEMSARSGLRADKLGDLGTYYVVICANKDLVERSQTISGLTQLRENRGLSLLFLGEYLRDLPRECAFVIDLSADRLLEDLGTGAQALAASDALAHADSPAHMFDRDDVSGTMCAFAPDIMVSAEQARSFALTIARARLDSPQAHSDMPRRLGFLEMLQAGNTKQLNITRRWRENDASRSLATPVGLDAQHELSILNLHENVHGPHGLIAGTTGSGKSEFIITYILSLCVNYAPDEVSFVLIDYKGGGLAGAFDNERVRLPHLAGTITNLDGAAINRSLVSIKSELKRRQDVFNAARDMTGEATMDIYKYLSYYRRGVLNDPLPHLFVVADEFAELKQQEPEFMDELISAARIGRSLGIHLVLATQKPTGVVNDQIWSNSRFKVCLKVADAADSKEMLRRPDAAEISDPGRFFLLVGYNEYFTAGQSAYTGTPYAPTDTFTPRHDDAVELIDDTGQTIASLRPPSKAVKTGESELNAVLQQIADTADTLDVHARPLWLDPIPARITVDALKEAYDEERAPGSYPILLGLTDDPGRQRQFPFVVDLANTGNIMLYGSPSSGVDGLLASALYGLVSDFGPKDLGVYIVDFDTGMLSCFAAFPQCGGVVLAGEEERLINLFRLLENEVDTRRRALAQAGLTFEDYLAAGEGSFPRIIIALSNLAAFYDLHPELEDRLTTLTRDAPRYGMHFIVTASTATVPRMRIRANFSLSVACALNDESDYVTIFGRKPSVAIVKSDKRGVVKVGKETFEFQGASVTERDADFTTHIDKLAACANARFSLRAREIPMLPAHVCASDMVRGREAAGEIPIGYSKTAIEPLSFSFAVSPTMLVLGNDLVEIARYLRGLIECLETVEGLDFRVIDTEAVLGSVSSANVCQDLGECCGIVGELAAGVSTLDLIVFTSVVQTVKRLDGPTATMLKDYLAQERYAGSCGIVAATEMFRGRSVYDEWYKMLTAYGNGVWVGSGFADQTTFRYARSLPEYRFPAATSDGFYCMRGNVEAVRLVESTEDAKDDEKWR